MAHPVQPHRPRPDPFHPCTVFCSAGIGLAGAMMMTRNHPLTGFFFGGVYHLVTHGVEWALSCFGDSETAKTVRVVLGILAGIAAAGAFVAVFGAEMSVEAACALTLAMVVARFAAPLFCATCCCSCCALAAGALPAAG